jgi:hypothetical protein
VSNLECADLNALRGRLAAEALAVECLDKLGLADPGFPHDEKLSMENEL